MTNPDVYRTIPAGGKSSDLVCHASVVSANPRMHLWKNLSRAHRAWVEIPAGVPAFARVQSLRQVAGPVFNAGSSVQFRSLNGGRYTEIILMPPIPCI